MTNITAWHGQGAVHLGAEGSEDIRGNWRPACGVQSINSYARTPAKLKPTDKPVSCKRCLKHIKPKPEPEPKPSGKTGIETLQELLTLD